MTNRLRTFLENRRLELQSEIYDLRNRLARAEAELTDLDRAKAAIPMVNRLDSTQSRRSGVVQPGTIKDYAVRVLADHPNGLAALDILADINRRFGTSYPRTSLSPQLSRLGQAGIIEREGVVWRLRRPLRP